MTAQLNGAEALGRAVCFVCLELVPSDVSLLNSNCKTAYTGFLIYWTRHLQVPSFLTYAYPAQADESMAVSKVRL